MVRADDSGQHWTQLPPAVAPVGPLVNFSDANHGWLVLGHATWRTSDGRRSWIQS